MTIAIIGAGVSGLTAALALTEAGRDVTVLEARPSPGGRIRSVRDEAGAYLADLGPTWVWPAHQPLIRDWMARLGMTGTPQFGQGDVLVEQGGGAPVAAMRLPGQEGSVRPVGGPQALIDALCARLPDGVLRCGARVREVVVTDTHVDVRGDDVRVQADRVIVALPPRIAVETIRWSPELPATLSTALRATPTWMAPHAKVVVLFKAPFWRARGLSGRIISRIGPLVEAHDHCGENGAPAALFGFVGWPAAERREGLENAVRAQLSRCFGADAPAPTAVHIEDWALDPLVATAADLSEAPTHPAISPDVTRAAHFGGRVAFAAAETAPISPGLIEGAFAAGAHAAALVG